MVRQPSLGSHGERSYHVGYFATAGDLVLHSAYEFVSGRVEVYAAGSYEAGYFIDVRRCFVFDDLCGAVRVVVVRPLPVVIFAVERSVSRVPAFCNYVTVFVRWLVDLFGVSLVVAE